MKFTLERQAALSAISRAASVAPSRGTIPILNHVLIEATGERVIFRASDLDMEVTVSTTGQIAAPGSTTVSADKLLQIVKNAAEGSDIEFALGERLAIKSGRSRFNLATLPVQDFPTFSSIKADVTFEIAASELLTLFTSVRSAQGVDAGRYILLGTHFFSAAGILGAVATDGHRLALYETPTDIDPFAVTIPAPAVAEICGLLDGAGMVTVAVSATKIHVSVGASEIASKVIDGSYPDFRRVIPRSAKTTIEIDPVTMIGAIRRASVAADDKSRSIKITFTNEAAVITSRGQEGDASDEIECDYAGDELTVGLNWSLAIDAMSAFKGETVNVGINDAGGPLLVTDGSPLTYVLMPLRV